MKEDIAVIGQDIRKNDAARERRRGLARVRQAVNDVGTEDEAVDDDLDVVLFVLLEEISSLRSYIFPSARTRT